MACDLLSVKVFFFSEPPIRIKYVNVNYKGPLNKISNELHK